MDNVCTNQSSAPLSTQLKSEKSWQGGALHNDFALIDVSGGGRSHATNLECGWGMTGILASGLLMDIKIGLARRKSLEQVLSTLPERRVGEHLR